MRFLTKFLIAIVGWNFLPPADAPAATVHGRHVSRIHAAPVTGATNPDVTQANIQQTICVPGWTKTVRPPASFTNSLKRRQLAQLRLKGLPRDYEEDHLISLEVGGSPRDPRNLWPQPWTGGRNAREKDRLENLVHRLICSGQITLAQGRRELSKNWVASYRKRIGEMR